jgi:lysine-specific demethylase 3
MYTLKESSEAPGGKGSTRLHMDMADAVNIMLYAAPRKDGGSGCAVWDIFRTEDANKIRSFLRRKFNHPAGEDPIHSQVYYLDSALRQELHEQERIYSWRIYQRPGEAVFVPAGCAHQASTSFIINFDAVLISTRILGL